MNRLAAYIDSHDMTQAEFAELAGLEAPYVSMIVRNVRCPGMSCAFAIEKATDGAIPAQYWLGQKKKARRVPKKRQPACVATERRR